MNKSTAEESCYNELLLQIKVATGYHQHVLSQNEADTIKCNLPLCDFNLYKIRKKNLFVFCIQIATPRFCKEYHSPKTCNTMLPFSYNVIPWKQRW